MNKREIRDRMRLIGAMAFFWLYIPHLLVYIRRRRMINSDLKRLKQQLDFKLPIWLLLLFFLHNNRYYRCLFYYRIGPVLALLISWYRPGDPSFIIPYSTKIGEGVLLAHPYSTVLNAEVIGDNFSCIHCTTIGKKNGCRPYIGNNVIVGCNSCIIGGIHIGDNVTIGAGSVVVTDVPDNAIVAGIPAKIIRFNYESINSNK